MKKEELETARLRLDCFVAASGYGAYVKGDDGKETFKTNNLTERIGNAEKIYLYACGFQPKEPETTEEKK